MKKSLLSFIVKGVFIYGLVQGGSVYGQKQTVIGEQYEKLEQHFWSALAQVQKNEAASDADFRSFERFNQKRIAEETSYLFDQAQENKINFSNIDEYQKAIVKKYTGFYNDFVKYKAEFPSSVAEYAKNNPPRFLTANCDSACTNPDFSSGTLNGWVTGYAENFSGVSGFNFTNLNTAPAGPVAHSAQDPFTSNSYQVNIEGLGNDAIIPSIPRVSPFSSSPYSAMVGDSTRVNRGMGILQQTFKVTAASSNFTYQYAVVLQNPLGHSYYEQPFFQAVVLDSLGDTIPQCGKYLVTSGFQTGGKGWDSTIYQGEKLYYRNWTSVFTPLKNYIGQCVTVRFTTADCALSGHFGYAYVTASCSPTGLITSSPAFCGQSTITLTAPPGGDNYKWTTSIGGSPIVGSDSSQTCVIDSSGTYTVVVSPVTGSACNDTLVINIPKAPGPIPHPNFSADTICAGQTMQFSNLSNPIGGKFYWDFYNLGTYTDSTTNPTYTYNTAGNYTVKLHEVNNGCGADTLISVKVDSNVTGTFVNNTVCVGSSMSFTNNTTGADHYLWNFGDPSSAPQDTSSLKNPTHTYNTAGSYTVTLYALNAGGCNDTVRLTVNVLALPKPVVSGTDSVCNGSSVLLTATAPGATTWQWQPSASVACPTCNSTNVSPTVTTTYTVTANNGFCTDTAMYTVKVLPTPTVTVRVSPANDTICLGDSAKLVGVGACTYTWSPSGSTNDSIWVKPNANTTYGLTGKCSGCSAGTTVTIKVMPLINPTLSLTKDSICPSDSAGIVLHLGGATKYKWLPPINTTRDTAYVQNASTYKVVVYSYCGNDTLSIRVHTSPVPVIRFSGNAEICKGSATPWTVSGGSQYIWTPNTGLSCNNCPNPNVSPTVTTIYTVQVSNGRCSKDTTLKMTVAQPFTGQILPNPSCVCLGSCSILTAKGGGTYHWLNNNSVDSVITVCPTQGTTYTVAIDKVCKDTVTQFICVDAPTFIACCDTTIQMAGSAALSVYGQSSANANWSWTPSTGLSCTNCPNPVASPTVTTTYTVTFTDSAGCSTSRVVTVELACDDFTMPNVFTPNDDGINDDFVPYYYFNGTMYNGISNLSNYSIKIYDRWGKLVYSSTDYRKYWNGRINNTDNLVPDGVYYWVIDATCVSGSNSNSYNKKGFVQVIGEK